MDNLLKAHSWRNQALSLAALHMAITHRRPAPGLLHHSDQGSAYVGALYREQVDRRSFVASMSRKGIAYDNAVVASIFSNLKNEFTHHRGFTNRDEARAEIFDYIEVFYNRQRAHAATQYMSPADYEDATLPNVESRPAGPGASSVRPPSAIGNNPRMALMNRSGPDGPT